MKKGYIALLIILVFAVFMGCAPRTPETTDASRPPVRPTEVQKTEVTVSAEDARVAKEMIEEARKLRWDKKNKEAMEKLEEAMKKNPNEIDAYLEMASLYRQTNDASKALETLDKALEKDPKNPKVWEEKAGTLFSQEKYEEAADAYKKQMEYDKETVYTYGNIADCYRYMKNYDEAEKYHKTAIEKFPDDSSSYEKMAWFWFTRSDGKEDDATKASYYDKAAEWYNKAMEKADSVSNKASEKFRYAECFYRKWKYHTKKDEDKKKALDAFKEYSKMDPEHGWMSSAKNYIAELEGKK